MKSDDFIFADAPEPMVNNLKERIGKLRLLMIDDTDIPIEEIQLCGVKMSKIPGPNNWDDVPLLRFSFDVIVKNETEHLELDVFFTETFQPNDSDFIIESYRSEFWFDGEGLQCDKIGLEHPFIDDLRYVLIELKFFDVLMGGEHFHEWHLNYNKIKEEFYKSNYLPYLPGVKQIKHVNEDSIKLIFKSEISIITSTGALDRELKGIS